MVRERGGMAGGSGGMAGGLGGLAVLGSPAKVQVQHARTADAPELTTHTGQNAAWLGLALVLVQPLGTPWCAKQSMVWYGRTIKAKPSNSKPSPCIQSPQHITAERTKYYCQLTHSYTCR